MKNKLRLFSVSMAAVTGLSAATATAQTAPAAEAADAPAPVSPAASGNLITVIKADSELSTFAKLAEAAGFATTFSGNGPLTVLAPTDAAFAALPAERLAELQKPENVAQLQQILLYHVIPAAAPTAALKGTAGELPSAKSDARLKVDGTADTLKINGAAVVRSDLPATNGTVHVIDTVLLPANG